MTVGKISGINMVISTVRNVEPNGENIIIYSTYFYFFFFLRDKTISLLVTICSLSQNQMINALVDTSIMPKNVEFPAKTI